MTTIYEVPDLLTLFIAAEQYPDGFIGVGQRPSRFYCCKSVLAQHAVVDKIRNQMEYLTDTRLMLFVDVPSLKGAMYFDPASKHNPKCSGCGKGANEHVSPTDRPHGVVPAELQERGEARPRRVHRRRGDRTGGAPGV